MARGFLATRPALAGSVRLLRVPARSLSGVRRLLVCLVARSGLALARFRAAALDRPRPGLARSGLRPILGSLHRSALALVGWPCPARLASRVRAAGGWGFGLRGPRGGPLRQRGAASVPAKVARNDALSGVAARARRDP